MREKSPHLIKSYGHVLILFLLQEMYQMNVVENQKKGMKRMSQTLTVKVKLIPTKEQIRLLEQSSHEYIKVINTLVSEMVEAKKSTKKAQKILKRISQVQ
ncbi:hypothetical protein IIS_05076 [Bacillus cereus VD131]|nr:hypothetical protein IIS_05076 [Bacillus cereus VD131]